MNLILAAHLLAGLVLRLDLFVLLHAHCLRLLGQAQQVGLICVVKLLVLSLQLALFLHGLLLRALKVGEILASSGLALLKQSFQLGSKLVLLLSESSVVAVLHVSYFVCMIPHLLVKLIVPGFLRALLLLLVLSRLLVKFVVPSFLRCLYLLLVIFCLLVKLVVPGLLRSLNLFLVISCLLVELVIPGLLSSLYLLLMLTGLPIKLVVP